MTEAMADEELVRLYRGAYHQACWYDGNNPGKQKSLNEGSSYYARRLVERGLRPADFQADIDSDPGAINRALPDEMRAKLPRSP
ncbi:hypothetical protein [Methylorubrum extorquens]